MTTLDRIKAHLADESQITLRSPSLIIRDNGFEGFILRKPFITRTGGRLSIQQSATHYCSGTDNAEIYTYTHHPMLDKYDGGGDGICGYVPLEVIANYIDFLEEALEAE